MNVQMLVKRAAWMNAKICRECAKYVNYVLGFARITHLYVKKYVKCVKNIRNVQMFVENVVLIYV
jgi:hypothetical protein